MEELKNLSIEELNLISKEISDNNFSSLLVSIRENLISSGLTPIDVDIKILNEIEKIKNA